MDRNKFYVLIWDVNKDTIKHYDVLPYFRNAYEKRVIDKSEYFKIPTTIDEFKKFVEDESMYQFWARCEYEMIIHGWPVENNNYKIDVHEQIMMNIDVISEILYNENLN